MQTLDMYHIMHQRSVWKDQDDIVWRIEMPDDESILDAYSEEIATYPLIEKDHATNLLAWFDRRALTIQIACFSCALASTADPYMGDAALEAIEHEIDMEFDPEPHEWLHSMPLYKALQERVR